MPAFGREMGKVSKFVERLRRVYTGSAPSMGFRKSAETETPFLLIIADVTGLGAKGAKAIACDIDAGIVNGEGLEASAFGQLAKAMGDVPLGIFLEGVGKGEIAQLIDFGSDFVVFGLRAPLEIVNKQWPGKILRVEPSLDQGLARAINASPLSVDAVLINGKDSGLTVERLLVYQRFAEIVDKPLLVTLSPPVTEDELKSLYEAGINGVVLSQGLPAEAFAGLKKTVAGLSKTVKRRARSAALLPRLGGPVEAETEVEEGEEL